MLKQKYFVVSIGYGGHVPEAVTRWVVPWNQRQSENLEALYLLKALNKPVQDGL